MKPQTLALLGLGGLLAYAWLRNARAGEVEIGAPVTQGLTKGSYFDSGRFIPEYATTLPTGTILNITGGQ